ncbi:hypothetical protein M514_06414 [Trichuris suis]|uniref:von Willebrand factor type C domain protein n=1 Tax=Trichuris suis TaxID=68888 RepID=A0A085M6B2_9BILA|nr:hypothetical protein M513_06414 [Trichuris suis]KFD71545.1 hypothetical protein M514_06414 [Trichuris suis]
MELSIRPLLLVIAAIEAFCLSSTAGQHLELDGIKEPITLDERQTQDVASLLLRKNFSILLQFVQVEHTQGTLFYVHTSRGKVFELYSSGIKGQLIVFWRRKYRVANLEVRYELDDEDTHQIIFELRNQYLRLVVDCIEAVNGEYPEIDFKLLFQTQLVHAHIGQRDQSKSRFYGEIKKFIISSAPLSHRFCGARYYESQRLPAVSPSMTVRDDPASLSGLHGSQSDADLMRNIERRMQQLEEITRNWGKQENDQVGPANVEQPAVPTGTGICPNCWEYLRFKVNYLEEEFKRWRESISTIGERLNSVLLQNRGCVLNGTLLNDGFRWRNETACIDCVCHLGELHCHPIGCPELACSNVVKVDGQCCPECGQSCHYMGKDYDHGKVFWPKLCVRCRCDNGDMQCSYESTSMCPRLQCPKELQITLENRCCPVCIHNDFCSLDPCHPDAICINEPYGRKCRCKNGFFGDGEDHCIDINECLNQSACGIGSRCVNTPGSYKCQCLPGYHKLNDFNCLNVIIH